LKKLKPFSTISNLKKPETLQYNIKPGETRNYPVQY